MYIVADVDTAFPSPFVLFFGFSGDIFLPVKPLKVRVPWAIAIIIIFILICFFFYLNLQLQLHLNVHFQLTSSSFSSPLLLLLLSFCYCIHFYWYNNNGNEDHMLPTVMTFHQKDHSQLCFYFLIYDAEGCDLVYSLSDVDDWVHKQVYIQSFEKDKNVFFIHVYNKIKTTTHSVLQMTDIIFTTGTKLT